jgi:hypothetical protein
MLTISAEAIEKVLEFATDKAADLVVGIIGTVIGFLLGFVLYFRELTDAKLKEELDTQQRHIDQIRWLAGVLRQLVAYATQQVEEVEVFAQKIKEDPSTIHQLPTIASYAVQRLMSPDNAPTFHAYNTVFSSDSDKETTYRDLIKKSDFVAAHTTFTLDKFQNYIASLYRKQLVIKELVQEATDDLSTIGFLMKPKGELSKYYKTELYDTLGNALIEYNISPGYKNQSLRELTDNFTKPLQQLLGQQQHIRLLELTLKFKRVNVVFSDLVSDAESFRKGFDQTQQKDAIKQLELIRQNLENKCDTAERSLRK